MHPSDEMETGGMRSIVSIIRKALAGCPGVYNCIEHVDEYAHCFDYEGGPSKLEESCVFDGLSDVEKSRLLQFWFSGDGSCANWGWKVNVELAKLAAKAGCLVNDAAESYLNDAFIHDCWLDCVLRVAYLGSSIEYETRLIDIMQERAVECGCGFDGLLIAAWFINTKKVDRVLAQVFTEWIISRTLDKSEFSILDIDRFLKRWEGDESISDCHRLRELLLTMNSDLE